MVSDDDDGPTRPHRLHGDDAGDPPAFADVKQPSATWSTLETKVPVEQARKRLVAGLARFRAPYELSEIGSGFMVRSTGKRPFIAEVTFAGWEDGTQVHISFPRATSSSKKHMAALREFVKESLEWGQRHDQGAVEQADAADEVRDGERQSRPSQLIRSVRQAQALCF